MSRTENTIYLLRRYVTKHGIAPTRLAEMPTAKTLRALEALVEKEYGREEAA